MESGGGGGGEAFGGEQYEDRKPIYMTEKVED